MALAAIHPGEHLAEELKELDMSAAELARQLDVPTNRAPSLATQPCASPTSLAQLPNSGSTCKVSMNSVSPRRRLANPSRDCRR